MRKVLTIFAILIAGLTFMSASVSAQEKGSKDKAEMKKEIREFKLKFVAQEIELREDQKAAFTETYNKMMDEEAALFHEIGKMQRRLNEQKNASEADYEQVANALTEAKARGAAIEKKYDTQFAKFLTSKQRFKMKEAEQKFRRKAEQMCSGKSKKGAHQKKR